MGSSSRENTAQHYMRADWNSRAVDIVGRKMGSLGDISITLLATPHNELPKRERAGISVFSLCDLSYCIDKKRRLNVAIKLNYGVDMCPDGSKMTQKKTGFRRISDEAVRAKTGKVLGGLKLLLFGMSGKGD